jgi:hypothetical protein
VLQKPVRRELYILVSPFRRPVLTRNQSGSMNSPEVAVYKGVASFCLIGRAVGKRQMPFGIFAPWMRLQERIFVVRSRLGVAPIAVENILVRVDKPSRLGDGSSINRIGSHEDILADGRFAALLLMEGASRPLDVSL